MMNTPGFLAVLKDVTDIAQSVITALGVAVAGAWAYRRYVVQGEGHAHIETAAEIMFIGEQDGQWIAELRAVLTNKGKVEHRVANFGFDLAGLKKGAAVTRSDRWGGQVDFPERLAQGSFLPDGFGFFIIGPGVTATYSHVTSIPADIVFVILHCRFEYADRPGFAHSMELTAKVERGSDMLAPLASGVAPA